MVLFLVGRLFSTYAMNVGFQFTVEVMPTCLRGQGNALVNVMSMVSQMASPYIVYSVKHKRLKQNIIFFSVCHIGEGPLSDHQLPLHAGGHTRPLIAGDCRPQDARQPGGHQGVRPSRQTILDAALQVKKEIQEIIADRFQQH